MVASNGAVLCRGVTKSFGAGDARVVALRGVDLEVRAGELMMLVGPSGCGKTTLISVMAGILDHDEGDCLVFGQSLRDLSKAARTRLRGASVGFIFQTFNLLPALTAAENVAIPLLIQGQPRSLALPRAESMLERMGMAEKRRALPRELSGGQQQRVAIARALIHEPRLLVCDEPTSALDHETGARIMELLREIALDPRRALVVVTHDSRIFSFADRIAVMDDGRIRQVFDSPAALAGATHRTP